MFKKLALSIALSLIAFEASAQTPTPQPSANPIDVSLGGILAKYSSCKEANRAGVSSVPVPRGYTPPGWKHSADRDKDGIACEKKKR